MKSTPAECTMPAAIGAAASLIAEGMSDDDLNLLSAVLVQLSDALATILAIRSRNSSEAPRQPQVPKKGNPEVSGGRNSG